MHQETLVNKGLGYAAPDTGRAAGNQSDLLRAFWVRARVRYLDFRAVLSPAD